MESGRFVVPQPFGSSESVYEERQATDISFTSVQLSRLTTPRSYQRNSVNLHGYLFYHFEAVKQLHARTLFTVVHVGVMVQVCSRVSQVLRIRFRHYVERHSVRCLFNVGKFLHHFHHFALNIKSIAFILIFLNFLKIFSYFHNKKWLQCENNVI